MGDIGENDEEEDGISNLPLCKEILLAPFWYMGCGPNRCIFSKANVFYFRKWSRWKTRFGTANWRSYWKLKFVCNTSKSHIFGRARWVPNEPRRAFGEISSLYVESKTEPPRTLIATEGSNVIHLAWFLESISCFRLIALRATVVYINCGFFSRVIKQTNWHIMVFGPKSYSWRNRCSERYSGRRILMSTLVCESFGAIERRPS